MKRLLLATLLASLVGCDGTTSQIRKCGVFAECDGPPVERNYETVTFPFPTDTPNRVDAPPKTADDYRSERCGEKCASRRARGAEAMYEAARNYDERMYRGWIPADDPRRWR